MELVEQSPKGQPHQDPCSAGIRQRRLARQVRRLLGGREVMRLPALAAALPTTERETMAILEELIAKGHVKRLRPVGHNTNEFDYYRLRRSSDAACLWQQHLFFRLRTGAGDTAPAVRLNRLFSNPEAGRRR